VVSLAALASSHFQSAHIGEHTSATNWLVDVLPEVFSMVLAAVPEFFATAADDLLSFFLDDSHTLFEATDSSEPEGDRPRDSHSPLA